MPNKLRFQDWKTAADNLRNGKCDQNGTLFETEGEIHLFGDRIPGLCVGLKNVLKIKEDFENVMLLHAEDALVYLMDGPKHLLKTCEPKPMDSASLSEGEADVKEK